MTEKISILYVHHSTGWGGAPINIINIIKELDKRKYYAKVLLIKDSIVSDILKENNIDYIVAQSKFYKYMYTYYSHTMAGYVKWYSIHQHLRLGLCWLLSRYYFAGRELRRSDCDLIHLNSSVLTDWLAPASQKCKVVYHIQEPLTRGLIGLRFSFFRYLVRRYANRVVAISEDNAKRIALPEKTTVVYNFAVISNEEPDESSYSSKKFLYLGGASEIKGFFTMLKALDYLNKDVIVLFYGKYEKNKVINSTLKKVYKNLLGYNRFRDTALGKLHSHSNAAVFGVVQSTDRLFASVCCLVSPFTVPHFSRPVIESHLHKKPVIVSDVEGMTEIVEHDNTGIIVPKNNPRALADAMNELASNHCKARALGEAGYRVAIKRYSQSNVQKIESIYEEMHNNNVSSLSKKIKKPHSDTVGV